MNSLNRKRRIRSKRIWDKLNRGGHVLMAIYFTIFNMIPQNSFALTGGPSQPEVQSFEPIGTSEMVDLFSGDFVYNLPLLDVGGYPINLSYHSGITNDQEASWVGLGWNVNPGTINRGMRGIPDDFDGDLIKHELNIKPNTTVSVNGGLDTEIAGMGKFKAFKFGVGVSMGINYNNYRGVGMELGADISASIANKNGGGLTSGLGLTSSSSEGVSIRPSLSLSQQANGGDTKLGLKVGTSMNSRSGISALTISGSISHKRSKTVQDENGEDVTKEGTNSGSLGGASFNLGQPTYSPKVGMQMKSFSMAASFKAGADVFAVNVGGHISGSFNRQALDDAGKKWENPAYGYFHAQNGQRMEHATMDFNREKDGAFTENTPGLPVTNFTYDVYSVSGQGVGGSYRPFRSEVGYVFDPKTRSRGNSGSIGVEVGAGNIFHGGGDIAVVNSNQRSAAWRGNGNNAEEVLRFRKDKPYPDYEPYYLKEANEKSVSSDEDYFNGLGGDDPVSFVIDKPSKFSTSIEAVLEKPDKERLSLAKNYRSKREKRNQILTFLDREQLEAGFGTLPPNPDSYDAPDHHVAEITTLNTSGERYIYGIAAYNLSQSDVTFAVGSELGHDNALPGNYKTGLVSYIPGKHDSKDNDKGLDNYYSKTVTPGYAHSYLLTNILSSDYVDNDGVKGPSDGDLGTYTTFEYEKQSIYKWRSPFGKNKANWSDGLKSDRFDDKASYTYGEKEIWYLKKIITKNHVAIFSLSDRADAHSVMDSKGQINPESIMKKMDKISLYAKVDYTNNEATAIPIKEVHFVYDYSLCQGIPNSGITSDDEEDGKLTLKEVYFTYQNSTKGAHSKYEFDYSGPNPTYNEKSYDRWGNYKLNNVSSDYHNYQSTVPAPEFPYVEQDVATQDGYASSWNLTGIGLPSGGKIEVTYESDDYAYVQHKKAQRMVQIVDAKSSVNNFDFSSLPGVGGTCTVAEQHLTSPTEKNNYLVIEIPEEFDGDMDALMAGNTSDLYFRCLTNTLPPSDNRESEFDYVSGYADVGSNSYGYLGEHNSKKYGYIQLSGASFDDDVTGDYNPITIAAIQFGRLHLSRFVWNSTGIDEPMDFGKSLLTSMLQVFTNLKDAFKNPNKALFNNGVGNEIIAGKSFLRLNTKYKKLGGGARVSKVIISDEWDELAGGAKAVYGQEYTYLLEDGLTSSGVAAYEPQLGGDENPWREPVYFSKKLRLAPDERMYQEKPYGESFFPSASVGYSRVTVKNITPDNVSLNNHGTGKVVNKFYTSKDYPTITKRYMPQPVRQKSDAFSIASLFKTKSKDFMTATQGFSIELNDMHGKPEGTFVYAQNDEVISSKEFFYKEEDYLGNSKKLLNTATVVDSEGNVSEATIGKMFDMVADFRRSTSVTATTSINGNAELFAVGAIPVSFVVVFGVYSEDNVKFKSATTTKVINRFGLLDKTVITDVGSSITTKTIAYDSETGNELISETTNNFEDPIYNLKFPAYWYYENMGQAYKNIGFEVSELEFDKGWADYSNANAYFFTGDELEVVGKGTRIWVTSVGQNNFHAIKEDGSNYIGTDESVKVLRSGRKNMMDGEMASLTAYVNPLNSIQSNVYQNVVQASAIEFTDQWRTFCDCDDDGSGNLVTTNPFVLGTKGNYKPKATYSYLTERTQTLSEGNLDIRQDGVYTSFTPFYKISSGNTWKKDFANWTFTEMITEFNPNGGQLESQDALGRYSAETYGYRNSVVTASAGNAKYNEIGFDGFEDHDYVTCGDQHFRFVGTLSEESHTGNKSLLVPDGETVVLSKDLNWCDLSLCDMEVANTLIGDYYLFSLNNAEAPIDVNWTVLSGSPILIPSTTSGYLLQVKDETGISVRLDFTDKNGCKVSTVLTL